MPRKRSYSKKNHKLSVADEGAMAECVLPQDIMYNIVTRLPVKSIHRFKAVCKPWCKLFATGKFMKMHHTQLSQNRENQSIVIYSFADKLGHVMSLYSVESKEDLPINLDHPYCKPLYMMNLVGCVNGLLCLACPVHLEPMGCGQWIELWNPALQRSKTISIPKLRAKYGALVSLGFGYDYENYDFKVVRIVHVEKKQGKNNTIVEVEVYSANYNSWEWIDVGFQLNVFSIKNQGILNGNPYWFANVDENEVLVKFNVTKMKFNIIPLTGINSEEYCKVPFLNWKGGICAIICNKNDERILSLDIWVFNNLEKVWIKNRTFGPIELKVDRFVQGLKNGEIVGECPDGKLFVLDADVDENQGGGSVKKEIMIDGAHTGKFHVCEYTESLAYFKGMEEVKAKLRGKKTRSHRLYSYS